MIGFCETSGVFAFEGGALESALAVEELSQSGVLLAVFADAVDVLMEFVGEFISLLSVALLGHAAARSEPEDEIRV